MRAKPSASFALALVSAITTLRVPCAGAQTPVAPFVAPSHVIRVENSTSSQGALQVTADVLSAGEVSQKFGPWTAGHFVVIRLTLMNSEGTMRFIVENLQLDYASWMPDVSADAQGAVMPYLSTTTPKNSRNLVGSLNGATVEETSRARPISMSRVVGEEILHLRKNEQYHANVLVQGFQNPTVVPERKVSVVFGFFPIDRIASGSAARLFLRNPGIFADPARLFKDPQKPSQREPAQLKRLITRWIVASGVPGSEIEADSRSTCENGKYDDSHNPKGERNCELPMGWSARLELCQWD